MTDGSHQKSKVWIEDFCAIFDNNSIVPTKNMSNNEKINTITRLIVLVFVFMLLIKYPHSVNFFLLSLLIILILIKQFYEFFT